MKRKEFQIFIKGELKATRYAYNTARRQIREEIKRIALPGEIWERHKETAIIGKSCSQIWTEQATGARIYAEVREK